MTTLRPDAVGVNQNQGGSVYPFMEPCSLAGIVSDIQLIYDGDILGDVSAAISRSSGEPRLTFFSGNGEEILDTGDDLELVFTDGKIWFFADESCRNTVRYSEYEGTPSGADIPSPGVKIVPRCWATSTPGLMVTFHDTETGETSSRTDLALKVEDPLDVTVVDTDTGVNIIIHEKDDPTGRGEIVRTINNVSPGLSGNFSLAGDNKTIVTTAAMSLPEDMEDLVTEPPDEVWIRHDGKECCPCSEYAEKFEDLNQLRYNYNYEVAYLKYLKGTYDILLERYNETVNERMSDLVKVQCIPGSKQTTVGFSVANPTSQSLMDVTVSVEIECKDGDGNDVAGKTKGVYVSDVRHNCQYPDYVFVIPELKAHSQWSGAVAVGYDICGLTATATVSADIPWFEGSVSCASHMSCNADLACPPVVIEEGKSGLVEAPLPKPPNRDDFFPEDEN